MTDAFLAILLVKLFPELRGILIHDKPVHEVMADRLTLPYLAPFARLNAAEELEAQAEAIERRIQYHGLGPHGVCARCEAWQVIAAALRRRAAAIREEAACAPTT